MKPSDDIKRVLKDLRIRAGAELDQRVYNELSQFSKIRKKQPSATGRKTLWRTIMRSKKLKFAAAAVLLIAAGIYFWVIQAAPGVSSDVKPVVTFVQAELTGPQTYTLPDGSTVQLAAGATINVPANFSTRGFEHCAGRIEVNVAKGSGEFIVATVMGRVKALGTVFSMDLVDGNLEGNSGKVKLLEVRVKEGRVEISNNKGTILADPGRHVTVESEQKPYDFRQDEKIPARLAERIEAMCNAMETGDKTAYLANYNIRTLYDLVKGNIRFEDHGDWFSGMSAENAKAFIKAFQNIENPEVLAKHLEEGVNIKGTERLYVRRVTLSDDGHAQAECVQASENKVYMIFTPQWTYFDNDWWQTDD